MDPASWCPVHVLMITIDILIGLVFYLFGMMVSIIIGVVSIYQFRSENADSNCCFTLSKTAAEYTFDKLLTRRGEKYMILSYDVPSFYLTQLFNILLQLWAVAFIQFWDDFFIQESYSCVTIGWTCCYDSRHFNSHHLDCSNSSYLEYKNISSTSVICYRFVFNLAPAIASAVGIVTTSALCVFLINMVLLGCGKKMSVCITVSTQVFLVLVTLLMTIGWCCLKAFSHKSTPRIVNSVAEIAPIGLLISFNIIFFPWYKFNKESPTQTLTPPPSPPPSSSSSPSSSPIAYERKPLVPNIV